MTPTEFLAAVADAFGPYAKSDAKPHGGEGYYVESEAKPYVVMLRDNDEPYEFATAEEAIEKAKWLKSAEDAQPEL